MNLRIAGGTAQKSRASGFLLQRRAHHAASRLTWVIRWLKRAYRHHAQSRELENPTKSYRFPVPRFKVPGFAGNRERETGNLGHEDAVEGAGALGQLVVAGAGVVAAAEQLVCDVQRGEDGETQRVGRRGRIRRCTHFLVHVGGQLRDVLRIQRGADRIPLTVDLAGDRLIIHYRFSASSWSSISATRDRITSRSPLSADSSEATESLDASRPRS